MAYICLSCTQGSQVFGAPVPFLYSFSNSSDYSSVAYYSDEYFSKPASTYNPRLATASLQMAMAGFAANREARGSYQSRFINGKEFLERAGFQDVLPNQFYKSKPTMDSFATIMGHKTLGEKTLVAVTVRGGNYESEWASNCTLGHPDEGKYAKGFREASDIYLTSLKDYIQTQKITGPIMLWTAGYSRGGATVNLSIGRIDEEIKHGTNTLLPGVSFQKEDVFAYCFEPPAGAYYADDALCYDIKGEAFNNIHCIVNLNDPVPMVAPREWNFARYGNEYFLSDPLTDLDHYRYINRVKDFYTKMDNNLVLGVYRIDKFEKKALLGEGGLLKVDPHYAHWTQGRYLADFVNRLAASIGGRDKFADNLQAAVRDIFEIIFSKNTPKDSMIEVGLSVARSVLSMDTENTLMTDLVYNREYFFDDLKPLLTHALLQEGLENNVEQLLSLVRKVFDVLLKLVAAPGGLNTVLSLFSKDNITSIAQAHRPELCLAHMMAMDPTFGEDHSDKLRKSYYLLRSENKAPFEVRRDGKMLAAFDVNGVVNVDSSLAYGVDEGQYVVYLPAGNEYDVALKGEGEVNLYRQSANASDIVLISTFSSAKEEHFSTPDAYNHKAI